MLDLTHLLAGPFATWLLAEAGADVLKVERPETGDGLRAGEPAQFARLNAGKRRVTLDLRRGGLLLRQLAERADLVVHNFRSWPFGQLPAPVLSLPGLAASGPYAGWRSYAATVHAMLGFSERLGPAPLPWADYLSGAWAANGALDILTTKRGEALPQAACMPATIPDEWPSLERTEAPPVPMPPLGEHNDEVYGELGLEEERINRLYVAGII